MIGVERIREVASRLSQWNWAGSCTGGLDYVHRCSGFSRRAPLQPWISERRSRQPDSGGRKIPRGYRRRLRCLPRRSLGEAADVRSLQSLPYRSGPGSQQFPQCDADAGATQGHLPGLPYRPSRPARPADESESAELPARPDRFLPGVTSKKSGWNSLCLHRMSPKRILTERPRRMPGLPLQAGRRFLPGSPGGLWDWLSGLP